MRLSNEQTSAFSLDIVSREDWSVHSGDGLALEVDDEPEARFAQAPLITINFPAFTDGRGLSLAFLLRTRFDFNGELRAIGAVHPDLIHYMRRCGFDSFDLAETNTNTKADQSTLAPYSNYYQASVLEPQPVYRRIRRGA